MKKSGDIVVTPEPAYLHLKTETPSVKTRTNLEAYMYDIAKEHKELAKEAMGADINTDMPLEIKESMISIFFTCACLETYINKIGRDSLNMDTAELGKRISPVEKWKNFSKELAHKDVFADNEEPLSSLKDLTIVRNNIIAHNKAEFHEVEATRYGVTDGMINSLNAEKADDAFNIIKKMIDKLHEEAGIVYPDWLK
jgi:hypothetical protein